MSADLNARLRAGAQDIEYDGYAELLREAANALAAERDRADRAELLIRDAPHESWCASDDWGNDLNPDDAPPCDCWKSEATA